MPSSKTSLNPGTMEDLHKACLAIQPMFFEGAKLLVNKGLSNNFQVSHTLSLNTETQQGAGGLSPSSMSGYRFGATYVGSNIISPTEAYPLLLADIDPSGNLNANIVHSFSESARFKFISQILQRKWQSAQITMDYFGERWTVCYCFVIFFKVKKLIFLQASATLGNPDFVHGTGVAVMHYLQGITRSLSLGAELAYQSSPQIPGGRMAVISAALKYVPIEESVFAATFGSSGQIHASYYQKCSSNLQMGIDLETNLKLQDSTATIGYEVNIEKGNFILRGSLDSNLTVKAVVEKKLLPLPFTLALCSQINHKKNQNSFGCGLIIG